VSHDLRAPLRAIDGFAKIFFEDFGDKVGDEGKRLLEVIQSSVKLMNQLIIALLSLSRAGKCEMRFIDIDTSALVQEVCNSLEKEMEIAGVEVSTQALPACYGDRTLLRQVWFNLLSNAIKFSSKAPIRKVKIGYCLEKSTPTYFVQDTGAGFNATYARKLFRAFQRLHRTDEFEGCGIGLAIVQRIISRHNGRVWAEGEVNVGAKFYFSIPAREK
jgi:light-regulated signal transduction histidine kinase (bacteriophytochrome)